MPAALTIHGLRARVPAQAQPVAARLALQALGADLEDALPPGLPPQALLWLRRLELQAPEVALMRPRPAAWRQAWVQTGQDRLDAALAHAARPALGPVPDSAEAVLFADAAEMLACLALAARAGELGRWWWRGLLGRAWPQWQSAWAQRPEAQAAAQRLLERMASRPAAVPARGAWGWEQTLEAAPFALDVEHRVAVRAEAGFEPERSLHATEAGPAPGEGPAPPAAGSLSRAATVADAEAATPGAAPAQAATARPAAERAAPAPSPLPPSHGSMAPHAAPAPQQRRGRAPRTADRPAISLPPVAPSRLPESPPAALSSPTPVASPGETTAGAPAVPPAFAEVSPPAHVALPHDPVAPRDPAGPPPGQELSPKTSRAPQAQVLAATAPRPLALEPPPQPAPWQAQGTAADAWPWPQALFSREAPLLFIINVLLEDGLYPDFTRPRDSGLPVPLALLLRSLALAWRLPADPLHEALARLGPLPEQPARMPAVPGVSAGDWDTWLPAYARSLRRRLCRRLGLRSAQWARALTLPHPARLWVSEAEWVAEFSLDSHDLAWRLAGLDRDPGWLPSTGISLRFRFS